jgi:hypothetical protein
MPIQAASRDEHGRLGTSAYESRRPSTSIKLSDVAFGKWALAHEQRSDGDNPLGFVATRLKPSGTTTGGRLRRHPARRLTTRRWFPEGNPRPHVDGPLLVLFVRGGHREDAPTRCKV